MTLPNRQKYHGLGYWILETNFDSFVFTIDTNSGHNMYNIYSGHKFIF